MEAYYPGRTAESLSNTEKSNISAISTLAAGLAGGVAGNSTNAAGTGSVSGKVTVENNALSAPDDQKRQDAKWPLPYLEGEKKEQAEKLISDLNAKDKAFDIAIDAACQNLSSDQCKGLRQDLAAMANSYDELLDGEDIGKIRSVYMDGAEQVDDLMWQYATADAKAKRDADIKLLATTHEISPEAAKAFYYTMAGVHTTAAIGGAVYGMTEKPTGVDTPKPSKPTTGKTPELNKIAADEKASGWSQYDQYRNGKGDWNWPAKLGFAEASSDNAPCGNAS